MKLLLDANGHAVLRNGMPVYTRDDGREIEFDGAQAFAKIGQLTGENAATRKRAEEAEAKIKAFDGIDDIDAARAALEKVKNIDDGKLIAAGKVEEIKLAAQKAAQEQVASAAKASAQRVAELEDTLKKRTDELYTHMVGGSFTSSKFIAEKCDTPVSLLRATFGQNFKVEDGKPVGYDGAGNKIYSIKRPGELADFDECVEVLVHAHPDRDRILKGSGASGGGSAGSSGQSGAKRVMTREAFNALSPEAQATAARDKNVAITD